MSQPTRPQGNVPSDDFTVRKLPTVAELGKGDPAVRAERKSGMSWRIGLMLLLYAAIAVVFVLVLIVPGCQHRV